MTSVSLANFAAPAVDNRVIQTTQDFPEEFPFNIDVNSGSPLGIGALLGFPYSRRSFSYLLQDG